jgi:hypothetical protein
MWPAANASQAAGNPDGETKIGTVGARKCSYLLNPDKGSQCHANAIPDLRACFEIA